MAFRVGQDVVCIKNYEAAARSLGYPEWPKKGEVYRIRALAEFVTTRYGITPCILLEEIVTPKCGCGEEHGWLAEHFRPLSKQRIAIIESLKAPPPDALPPDLEPLHEDERAFQ